MAKQEKMSAWEKMQKKMEEDKEKTKSSGFPWMSVKEPGEYKFRLMTPNDNFDIYMLFGQHYFGFNAPKGVESIICPQVTLGEPCPVCELRAALPTSKRDRSVAEQKMFELLYPTKRYGFMVLDRKAKQDANILRVLYTNSKLGKQVLDNLTSFNDGDDDFDPSEVAKLILDPKNGTDFFLKIGQDEQTNKRTHTLQLNIMALNKKGIPIVKGEDGKFDKTAYEALLETPVDWSELIDFQPYEVAEDLLHKNLELSGFDFSDSEKIVYNESSDEDEQDEPEEKEEKPKVTKPKPKPVAPKKAPVEPEPEEDDEPEDAPESEPEEDESNEPESEPEATDVGDDEPESEPESEPEDDEAPAKEMSQAEKLKILRNRINKNKNK